MSLFTHTNFAKAATFSTGIAIGYVTRNPDKERAWEVYPCFTQKDYAYLSLYNVTKENVELFEKRIKCLTRYLQTQRGYGYTRLVKFPNESGIVKYIGISTWFSGDLMQRGVENSFAQKMISKLPIENSYNAVSYKIVVDDSEYLPDV